MTIQIGDKIPAATLAAATADGPKPISTDDIFAGKTVALFAVPGAFTPTCSARHLPGYVDNGAALMLYQLRTSDGSPSPAIAASLLWPDGRQQILTEDDFTVEAVRTWTSPATGITYPSGWRIRVPAAAIELDVEPLIDDQEMRVSFVYWEGAVTATGAFGGDAVTARGYVELTGYGDASTAYQR